MQEGFPMFFTPYLYHSFLIYSNITKSLALDKEVQHQGKHDKTCSISLSNLGIILACFQHDSDFRV